MIYRITFILLLFMNGVKSQQADFIILKKKGKTIRSYYAGTSIEFVTLNGIYKNGLINKIEHDSIFLQEFLVQQLVTPLGYYVLDTVGSFRYVYHYQHIKSLGKPEKGFNVRGSGAALMGGGILLTFASGISYLADKEKFSPELLGAAVGLGFIGYLMSKAGSKGIVIGKKKYQLQYISLTKK